MLRRLAHETLGVQKQALVGEIFHAFQEGDRVMTVDGLPGKVSAVLDGPYPQTEIYEVRLDGNAGGGQYTAGQLSKLADTETTAVRGGDPVLDFGPIEATTAHVATDDYPELGDILTDRPPNERIRVFARLASVGDQPEDDTEDASLDRQEGPTVSAQSQEDKGVEADEKALPAVEPIDPPDACSFCGNPEFENPTNTGRGVRMRCTQCGGTMTSWGGQWQPDMPNSPENAASRQGDFRSTINDPMTVHAAYDARQFAENVMGRMWLWNTGEPDNRALAASIDPDLSFHMIATWADVRRKAKRIKDEGGVRIVAASHEGIVGEVQGEHHLYESSFTYVPGRKSIAAWDCGCKWGAYAWGRAPAYARFEGRQCSHVTALQFEAQSRGMFGVTVQPDEERLEGQYQRSPVTVDYQRPTERAPGGNKNRRSVPPGNMRRTFSSINDDLAPVHVFAMEMVARDDDADAVLHMLASYGVSPEQGLRIITWAADKNKNGIDDAEEATADPMGGQAAPGTDIPRLEDRDQTDAKHKKKHLLHHTNDAREHAPNFGWGIGHGIGPLIWCDQCNGSGCGHCGGTGQVTAPGGSPTGNMGPGDASMTGAPIADQSPDAGEAVSGDGLSATSAREYRCDCCQGRGEHSCGHECYACDASGHQREQHGELCDPQNHHDDIHGDWKDDVAPERHGDIGMAPTASLQQHEWLLRHYADMNADSLQSSPGQTYQVETPHSNSPNPGSTGWATSADPGDWEQPIIGHDFGISDHYGAKEGEPGDPPTVSGVALKAADTNRVLMIQRSNKDEKDPARGTWEFPGGHHEEGDQTSLHAGIREWEEETGHPFPEGGHVSHTWRSGPYQGHVVVIPKEEAVDFSNGRATTNPDDPDGDDHEQSAWWEIEHAKKNPALRSELKDANPWSGIAKAAALSAPCETPGAQYSTSVSGDTAEVSVKLPFDIPVGTAADADHLESHMHNAMEEILAPYFVNPPKAATLHDEPEPALPSTDGADESASPEGGIGAGMMLSAQPQTPWGYRAGDPDLMQAQPPTPQLSAADYEGDAAHDSLTDDTVNNLPFRSEGALEEVPIEGLVGAFQATAGGQALAADAKNQASKDGPTDADIAENMRRVLAGDLSAIGKTAMKDFSFSEQQELISEGGNGTRARNFNDLQIEGTHYSRLGDDIVDEDEYLLL